MLIIHLASVVSTILWSGLLSATSAHVVRPSTSQLREARQAQVFELESPSISRRSERVHPRKTEDIYRGSGGSSSRMNAPPEMAPRLGSPAQQQESSSEDEDPQFQCLGTAVGDRVQTSQDCTQAIERFSRIGTDLPEIRRVSDFPPQYVYGECIVWFWWSGLERSLAAGRPAPLVNIMLVEAATRVLNEKCIAQGHASGVFTNHERPTWGMVLETRADHHSDMTWYRRKFEPDS